MDRLLKYFAENSLLVNLIVVAIFAAGLLTLPSIKREMYPSVELDRMMIYAVYPGASSTDVEMNAVIPIEKELRKISGIREFSSYSIENLGTISLSLDYNLQNAQAVKDEVFRTITRTNLTGLSEDVERIKIFDLNPKLMDIMTLAVSFNEEEPFDEGDLNSYADTLEDQLLKVNGVSAIRSQGHRDSEIHINVDLERMNRYYVSLNDIVNSIKARNIRATGGTLQSLQHEQTIVTIGQFDDPMDVKDVIIRSNFEGRYVRIADVATVKPDFQRASIITRVDGRRAIMLKVVKKENADIGRTADAVKEFLDTSPALNHDRFQVEIVESQSDSINAMLQAVAVNALIGFLLVIVVLIFFLNFRTSFWIAFAIPTSLFITMVVLNSQGFTINLVSMAAVVTILGMLVDDGIVIGEAIYSEKEKGYDSLQSVVAGVRRVASPVTVSITTTIVAFLPMLSIRGLMGKVIFIFPTVITVALVASLLEAFLILPNHLHHVKVQPHNESGWFRRFEERYRRVLSVLLKFRYGLVLVFVMVLLLTIAVSRETVRGLVLFWDDSADRVFVNCEAADGISLEYMDQLTMRVEKKILSSVDPEHVVSTRINVGHHDSRPGESQGNHENWSQVIIALTPRTTRDWTAEDLMKRLRRELSTEDFPGMEKFIFEKMSLGPPTGDPVNIKITSKDLDKANELRQEVESYLATIEGVYDIDNDQKAGKRELKVHFDYRELSRLNLSVASVARTVRTAYEGTIATSIETIDDTLDFRVQVDERFRKDRKFLESLVIPNYFGRLIRLDKVAGIERQEGKSIINHYNGERVVTITANVNEDLVTSSQVADKVMKRFGPVARKNPHLTLSMGGEARETEESLGGLKSAFIMAILFIYFLLVLLFRSFSQPLLIMITVPFGVTGALLAFTLHGIPLTFMGIVGIIGLSGVVVNDNIVMIDFLNSEFKKENDENPIERIAAGAARRLRAITLTTLTTVLGLMPTVYGIGGISNAIVPTVMAMAYGLIFATLLTLLFVPSLYLINRDIQKGLASLATFSKRFMKL